MGFQSKIVPEEVLRVEEVTVNFTGFKALNGVNYAMERGELRVVIGPNGAGKTTWLDVITGKVRPRSGQVVFQGRDHAPRDITRRPEQDIARLGVGRKFQTPNIFKSLSVLENLRLAVKAPRGVLPTLAASFTADRRARVQEVLELIGLQRKANLFAGLLAHGEKQWLELGMLVAQDPELLLIDEPVAGMAPKESERTGELLLSMARKHTLLVIDHDMTFVRQIASKVTVLHEGQMLCQGTMQEVQRNPRVIQVYLGEDRETDVAHRTSASVVR